VAQAQTVQTDRYTKVRVNPSPGQISPLDEVTRIVFGDSVKTVGQAIVEVLDGSGYELRHIKDVYEKPIDSILMAQPLPEIHRQLGPITIHDALEVLAGEAWHLKTNSLGRELWFVLNSHFSKDTLRLKRLLRESSTTASNQSSAAVNSANEFYVIFPPGNVTSPKNNKELTEFVNAIDKTKIKNIRVHGQSYSTSNGGKLKLAKARARLAEKVLRDNGIPDDQMTVTYNALNQQATSSSGVLISIEDGEVDVGVSTKKSNANDASNEVSNKDERVVESPTVFRFYRGEDLESALRRWVKRAGYSDLVWDVKDREQHYVTIPISADAVFDCDFLECLRRVKQAYAEADVPRYFDIKARGGNQIVTIRLLHLSSNI
jgi:conjugative transfer region protein (TIGR03748 family)